MPSLGGQAKGLYPGGHAEATESPGRLAGNRGIASKACSGYDMGIHVRRWEGLKGERSVRKLIRGSGDPP